MLVAFLFFASMVVLAFWLATTKGRDLAARGVRPASDRHLFATTAGFADFAKAVAFVPLTAMGVAACQSAVAWSMGWASRSWRWGAIWVDPSIEGSGALGWALVVAASWLGCAVVTAGSLALVPHGPWSPRTRAILLHGARLAVLNTTLLAPLAMLIENRGPLWSLIESTARRLPLSADSGAADWLRASSSVSTAASTATLAVVASVALGGLLVWQRLIWPRYAWYTSERYRRLREALADLRQQPGNLERRRDVGRRYLALGQARLALPFLCNDRASSADPEGLYLQGVAQARLGAYDHAASALRKAGILLEGSADGGANDRADLLYETTLALAAVRLKRHDVQGALHTAEAARSERPTDSRALLVYADALLALGRGAEARRPLELALLRARGLAATEIRQRLRTLG